MTTERYIVLIVGVLVAMAGAAQAAGDVIPPWGRIALAVVIAGGSYALTYFHARAETTARASLPPH